MSDAAELRAVPPFMDQERRRNHRPRQTLTPPEEDLQHATLVTLNDSGQVSHAFASGGTWAKYPGTTDVFWETIPSDFMVFRGDPIFLTAPGPHEIYAIFAVGQDNSLYNSTWTAGSGWSGWKLVSSGQGQGIGDSLSAVQLPNGEAVVVMQGRGTLEGELLYYMS